MHRGLTISTLCCLCLLGVAADVSAEVAVKLDHTGAYVAIQVTEQGPADRPQFWTPRGDQDRQVVLNPDGDLDGDLRPVVAESPAAPFFPWVMWSRFNGSDYDLAWSSWTGSAWRPVEWVQPTVTPGNDLDPYLEIDAQGRAFVVWWSEDQGQGTVYLTMFLANRWMSSVRVSDEDTDSRYPEVRVGSDGSAQVGYITPVGPKRRKIWVDRPVTITDDIDPQVTITDDVLPDGSQQTP